MGWGSGEGCWEVGLFWAGKVVKPVSGEIESAPGPGNGLSKGKEAGRSPVCLWDGVGRELGSHQAEGVTRQGSRG